MTPAQPTKAEHASPTADVLTPRSVAAMVVADAIEAAMNEWVSITAAPAAEPALADSAAPAPAAGEEVTQEELAASVEAEGAAVSSSTGTDATAPIPDTVRTQSEDAGASQDVGTKVWEPAETLVEADNERKEERSRFSSNLGLVSLF